MTISVTPDEAFEPPRNEINVAITPGLVMTEVAVYRNDSTGRTLTRQQPLPGFDERTVYDYEAPYGESVTYDWTATFLDPSEYSPSFTENWSSYPTGWVGDTALGGVASGELSWTTVSGDAELARTTTFEWQQIEIESLSLTDLTHVHIDIDLTSGLFDRWIKIAYFSSTELLISVGTGITGVGSVPYTLTYDPDQPITFARVSSESSSGVLVSSDTDSHFFTMAYGPVQRIRFETTGTLEGLTIGQISAVTAGAETEIAEESSAVTLNSDRAWLIHPSTVGLSFPLEETDTTAAGIAALDEVGNRTATTLHPILGSANPVAITTGIRNGDETAMIVTTVTSDERVALRALLSSDFPILIQIPPAWELGFEVGFYAVGDTRETRSSSAVGSDPWRQFRLPLVRVQAPIADVQETSWTWAHLPLEVPTWAAVKAAFATWAGVATNTRV